MKTNLQNGRIVTWAAKMLFCSLALSLFFNTSCKYDDTDLMNRVDDLAARIVELEKQCKQINLDIDALQTIIDASQSNDYITHVSEVEEDGVKIGYKIEFAKRDAIIIYHGKNGSNGADGADGYVPQIGVQKDKDGVYYWTLDGDWLKDEKGNRIKAEGRDGANGYNGRDGITPKLRIYDGKWQVSYDNEKSWTDLGSASSGGSCSCPITGVTAGDQSVTFTLTSGSSITLPYYKELTITFEQTELGVEAGSTAEFTYTLSYDENVKVSAIGEGVRTKIEDGKLIITADDSFKEGKVLVHATDGTNVATVELQVKVEAIIYVEYGATEKIELTYWDLYPAFMGDGDLEYLPSKSSFNDGKGKWAFKGDLKYVRDAAFSKNTTLTSITLPESIIDFGYNEGGAGSGAFEGCSSLETITIQGAVTIIRNNAFNGCSSLKGITIPESVTEIQYNAFKECTSLTSITIPDQVTEIEKQAFSQCSSLTTVTIGSNVKSIGKHAFNECKKLKTITCKGETPPTLDMKVNDTNDKGVFPKDDEWYNITYISNIFVPSGSVENYKKCWSDYKDKIKASSQQ